MHQDSGAMGVTLRQLVCRPLFLSGLLIRLLLLVFAAPAVQSKWFVPFLREALDHPSIDPWAKHLALGGDPMGFPYGPVMYILHAPLVWLGDLIDRFAGTDCFAGIGFGLTIVGLDIGCLLLLEKILKIPAHRLLLPYWLSPIVIYICYWHGQTDMVPVYLLLASLYFLQRLRMEYAGVALALAVAAKLSMLLPLPFLCVYFLRNKRIRWGGGRFLASTIGAFLLVQGPYLLSPGVHRMVLQSPEIQKVYRVAISIGEHHAVYILPLTYLLLVYMAWRIGRMSFDLMFAFLGMSFFLVLLLAPASIGWFLWTVPFLVAHQVAGGPASWLLGTAFSTLLIGFHLVNSTGAYVRWLNIDLVGPLWQATAVGAKHLQSLWLTAMTAVAGVLSMRMLREGVQRNDFYRLSRRPLAIGIAGDSGSGKDTLNRALAGLFGDDAVVNVSGDDYHLWDRHAPMWRAFTHLNPQANDLVSFSRDVMSLMDGKPILCRHYDHKAGRFTKASIVQNNDVILVSGLHALYVPALGDRFDVRIFLAMNEDLRRFFKIRRDVYERGHDLQKVLESIERRRADTDRFINPQKSAASLVFALEPTNPEHLDIQRDTSPALHLRVLIRQALYWDRLVRVLIGLCGLHVDMDVLESSNGVSLMIDGEIGREDIALAASQLIPQVEELLAIEPQWEDNMMGIMQLITLFHLTEVIRAKATE
jgi:uridine kinase